MEGKGIMKQEWMTWNWFVSQIPLESVLGKDISFIRRILSDYKSKWVSRIINKMKGKNGGFENNSEGKQDEQKTVNVEKESDENNKRQETDGFHNSFNLDCVSLPCPPQ